MQSKITKITAQHRRGRFNLFIDGHYALPVSENVLVQFQLVKGMEVDSQFLHRLVMAEQVDRGYQVAINYLANQLRTKQEVVNKLQEQLDDSAVMQAVIDKLIDNRLIDDQDYANSYVRSAVRMQDKGPLRIEQDLKRKGIQLRLIDAALTDYYPQSLIITNGIHQAQKMFQRYRQTAFVQTLQKIKAGLARKGYSFELISIILEQAHFTPDLEQQHHALQTQFQRAWLKYRHFDHRQRSLKVKQFLYRKGFTLDEIDALIDQQLDSKEEE